MQQLVLIDETMCNADRGNYLEKFDLSTTVNLRANRLYLTENWLMLKKILKRSESRDKVI